MSERCLWSCHGAARRSLTCILAAATLLVPAGCSSGREPVRESRQALGTIVTIEAFGEDDAAVTAAVAAAFDAIATVEAELDAYDPGSAVAAINADPFRWHTLPPAAVEILDVVDALDAGDAFSPALYGLVALYDFDGEGHVPSEGELSAALMVASALERDGDRVSFAGISSSMAMPGLDFGGAAKGLALDRARDVLRASGTVTAALVSAGSTTVTLGDKPGGKPWRIGIEDPRQPGTVRAVASWTGDAALSTSGDYQQYFESNGVRYHHILDPATGLPAEGSQSLTVVGRVSGLESDILSTALFVRGPARAQEYAHTSGAGLFVIDADGAAVLVDPSANGGITLTSE